MIERVTRWKCLLCGQEHREKKLAEDCSRRCAIAQHMTTAFLAGATLGEVAKLMDNPVSIPGLEDTTFRHGFVIEHWQCCDHPAYHIYGFDRFLRPLLSGFGGWMGSYGDAVAWRDLGNYLRCDYIWRYGG